MEPTTEMMKTRLQYIGAFLLLVGLVTACQNETAETTLSAEWTEVRVIGADESEPESLLGLPWGLALHPAGIIFVHDMQQQRIQVYATHGTYRGAVGRQGQGPGEFERIGAMSTASNGDLVVYDEVQRRITRFDTEGNVLDQVEVEDWFDSLLPHGDGFLIAGRSQAASAESGYFRTVGAEFEVEHEFPPLSEIIDTSDPVAYQSIQGPVTYSPDGDRLYWAPYFYDGTIRVFEKTAAGWEPSDPLQGRVSEQAYATHTGRALEENQDRVFFVTLTADGEIGVEVFSWSLGIAEQSDGRVVHFLCYEEGGERVFGVEVFEADGTYRGLAELERYAKEDQLGPHLRVEAQDAEGRLYVRDMANAVVRVFELTLAEAE